MRSGQKNVFIQIIGESTHFIEETKVKSKKKSGHGRREVGLGSFDS